MNLLHNQYTNKKTNQSVYQKCLLKVLIKMTNQHNKPTILTNRQVGHIGNLVKPKRIACSFTILTF
jgi:hypothetical protein